MFSEHLEGHMSKEETLRLLGRSTLRAFSRLMKVASIYRKVQKQLKKKLNKIMALYLVITLARPPIYNEAQPDVLLTAFPGNQLGHQTQFNLIFL